VEALRKAGYQVIDLASTGDGIPDLMVVSKYGRIVLIEIKSPGGRLTEPEKRFITEFTGPVRIVRSAEEAIEIMQGYDEEDE
jgi:hypothetical protein